MDIIEDTRRASGNIEGFAFSFFTKCILGTYLIFP